MLAKTKFRFDLSKALFILPNTFTVASIFCGLYAILNAVSEKGPEAFYQSAIAIFLAGFFDMFDGRIARLTKTQSEFGVQLDSLADMVSFGVAPAVVVYKWALWSAGPIGFFAAFCFAACGAIRLARHNIMVAREPDSLKFFMGLPIPLAASMLVALVIAHFKLFDGMPVTRHILILVLVFVLAFLMVSSISYWTFKEIQLTPRSMLAATLIVGVAIGISRFYPASVGLVVFIGLYIGAGIFRAVWHFATHQKK